MVSPLWKACSDGDLQKALELLSDASAVDIELKDHTGITPLIEAVKNGHIEVVRALLEKGADPSNASSQGRPEQYTSDPTILDLLHAAQAKIAPNGVAPQQPVYPQPGQDNGDKGYYAPPPDAYTYYPTINPSLSTVSEVGAYYPPQPHPNGDTSPNGLGNVPPPDVARTIPCRYFPACRYGATCMFAHPQPQQPYFQGPPPTQYPPYDPMGSSYVPQYYPSPSFQQQPGAHPMSPMSPPPGPPMMHARTPSDVMSPSLGHFSPNGAPPPPGPYGPMSPPIYSHPGQVPMGMQPIPPLAPLPPLHPHAPHPHSGPQPHVNLYNSSISPVPPFALHQDAPGPYPMPPQPSNINYPDNANSVKLSPENAQGENYTNHPNPRDGGNPHRRGAGHPGRRSSFNARKPPCAFFPAGRCKNGDDCRFPHVLESGTPQAQPVFPPARPGPRPPRGHMNGNNGFNHAQNIEAKLGNLTIRDEQLQQQQSRSKPGTEASSRSHSSDAGNRPKFQQGGKHPNGGPNGNMHKKAATFRHQQRVPNADEFPVLAGSITPPIRNPVVNGGTLTAAQILSAPAPRKDGSKESSTRGPSPDLVRAVASKEAKAEATNGSSDPPASTAPVQQEPAAVVNVVSKPAMSFAAAAATSGATDVSKEVSVSA